MELKKYFFYLNFRQLNTIERLYATHVKVQSPLLAQSLKNVEPVKELVT